METEAIETPRPLGSSRGDDNQSVGTLWATAKEIAGDGERD